MTEVDHRPAWGASVVQGVVDGYPCRLYEHRRRSVSELLIDARRWAERTYLVGGNRRISYRQHEAAVIRVAARLRSLGVGPGERIAFLAANQVEWVVAFWAVLRLGAVAVAGNAWWSAAEVARCIEEIEPSLVLTDPVRAERLPGGISTLLLDELRADVDGACEPVDMALGAPPDEDSAAMILFTSGTTGAPKGAVLSHRSVIANQQSILLSRGRLPADIPIDRPGAVSLLAVPLFHIGGIQAILTSLIAGSTLVFTEGRFDAGEVLRLIEAERVTLWSCVPTMLARVLDHPHAQRRDLSSIRSVTISGAPVTPDLVAKTQALMPTARRGVGTVFGGTEAGGVLTTAAGDELVSRPGYVGKALPVVELRISEPDETGLGEILGRSPSVMTGYWGKADDSTVDADGWLHTGDLGRLDDEGRLFVVDRLKDVIIRGGENIAGPHVEACLRTHPAVAEVAVVGLPHPDLGEEVGAVVMLRPGSEVTGAELAAHARLALGKFQVPTAWWLRTEPLPTNTTGKVLKRQLLENWPR